MKNKLKNILIILLFTTFHASAQDVTTVEATSTDISENLDLEAVASIFGEAENLEDFEKKLNDPKLEISNLDLSGDGEVDYLRVVEASKDGTHLITIQAIIGEDKYQDVATIDVEKDNKGETQVQVVGDVYMYGPDVIITPVYVHPPVIFVWFWGPLYKPWYSPYHYRYYPPYYRPRPPHPHHYYKKSVHVHVNVNNTYNRTTVRKSTTSVNIQKSISRNDYAKQYPNKSHNNRTNTVKTQDANRNKTTNKATNQSNNKPSTGKKVQDDWKPTSEKNGNKSNVNNNKVSVPSNNSKPNQSSNNNQAKPNNNKQNITKPANTTTQPASKQNNKQVQPSSNQNKQAQPQKQQTQPRQSQPVNKQSGGAKRR